MKGMPIVLMLVVAIGLSLGCSRGGDEAVAVAREFWDAMIDEDIERARACATEESAGSISINEESSPEQAEVTLGSVTQKDDHISISTTVIATDEGQEMNIPLETIVVQENGAWKVDAGRTMMSMFGGAMAAMMQGMTDAMADGMEEMGQAMGQAMTEGFEGAVQEGQ